MIKELGAFKSYKEVMDYFPRSVVEINGRTKWVKEMFVDDLEKHTCERTDDGIPVSINQRLSVFNPLLGMEILKVWSNVGDKVLDPFAGRDRALITNFMERYYSGYEISPKTFKVTTKKIAKWKHLNKTYWIDYKLGDGIDMATAKDGANDFCYSCPPYWKKEKYESVAGQVSDMSYVEWICAIERLAKNLKLKLKKDAYAVFVIADIRDKGEMVSLHSDWIMGFKKAEWKLHDIIINKTNPINVSGINGYLRNRFFMKSHEYLLVFKNA